MRAAAALPISHGFTAAPVVDAHRRPQGIATEADLVRERVVPDGWAVEPDPATVVAAVMTPDPIARPDDDLADVVATMLDRDVRR